MGRLEMRPADLGELHTLMELYERTYGQVGISAAELKENVRKSAKKAALQAI